MRPDACTRSMCRCMIASVLVLGCPAVRSLSYCSYYTSIKEQKYHVSSLQQYCCSWFTVRCSLWFINRSGSSVVLGMVHEEFFERIMNASRLGSWVLGSCFILYISLMNRKYYQGRVLDRADTAAECMNIEYIQIRTYQVYSSYKNNRSSQYSWT